MSFLSEIPVYRTRPLPTGQLRGKFLLTGQILEGTRRALEFFDQAGRKDGGHEGIALWAGYQAGSATVFTTVIVPRAEHSFGSVFVSAEALGEASRQARSQGVSILAQVHSHPGFDTRHSDGDDELILLPFEGMLSLVAPNFGRNLRALEKMSVHQLQEGVWTLCDQDSVAAGIKTISPFIELQRGRCQYGRP